MGDPSRKQEKCGAERRLTISHGGQFQDHMEGAFNVGEVICDRKTARRLRGHVFVPTKTRGFLSRDKSDCCFVFFSLKSASHGGCEGRSHHRSRSGGGGAAATLAGSAVVSAS